MSLNQISANNPNIDVLDIKVKYLTTDSVNIGGSITAQAIVTDQLAVANTVFPLNSALSPNLLLESNFNQELTYEAYNFVRTTQQDTIQLQASVDTEVVGSTATLNYFGSFSPENFANGRTYKLVSYGKHLSPNGGNLTFTPKIGTNSIVNIPISLAVSNLDQQMRLELIFTVISGAGTANTTIAYATKIDWQNDGNFTQNSFGTSNITNVDTSTAQERALAFNMSYSTTSFEYTNTVTTLNRLY